MRLEPDSSARAACEGTKPSCSTAFLTRAMAAGDTEPLPLMTREAVPRPTPANVATSLMVATHIPAALRLIKQQAYYTWAAALCRCAERSRARSIYFRTQKSITLRHARRLAPAGMPIQSWALPPNLFPYRERRV
jgi:hypothetical protein